VRLVEDLGLSESGCIIQCGSLFREFGCLSLSIIPEWAVLLLATRRDALISRVLHKPLGVGISVARR
jgi:hypothetical protein